MHKQLQDFAQGKRNSAVMLEEAKSLSEEEMFAIGLSYQSLKPAVTAVSDEQLAQVGQLVHDRGNSHTALPARVTCRGTAARGSAELPRLAGQHPECIVRQIKAFEQRERSNETSIMHVVADRVSGMELQAVAAYLRA